MKTASMALIFNPSPFRYRNCASLSRLSAISVPTRTRPRTGCPPVAEPRNQVCRGQYTYSLDRGEGLLVDQRLPKLESELAAVRHKHFAAQRRRDKLALQKRDAKLREEIAGVLADGGMSGEASHQLAAWDPYDQNASAPFFDPEWMYGIADGFNVVIGNPPYGINFDSDTRELLKMTFTTYALRGESYVLFIERAVQLLKRGGALALIVPDTYLNLGFTQTLRDFLLTTTRLSEIYALPANVFSAAVVDTTLLFAHKADTSLMALAYNVRVRRLSKTAADITPANPAR